MQIKGLPIKIAKVKNTWYGTELVWGWKQACSHMAGGKDWCECSGVHLVIPISIFLCDFILQVSLHFREMRYSQDYSLQHSLW